VDVCIVACTLIGEILAEIVAVHADGCREFRQGQVWLQVELRVLTVFRQQFADIRSLTPGPSPKERGVFTLIVGVFSGRTIYCPLLGRGGRG